MNHYFFLYFLVLIFGLFAMFFTLHITFCCFSSIFHSPFFFHRTHNPPLSFRQDKVQPYNFQDQMKSAHTITFFPTFLCLQHLYMHTTSTEANCSSIRQEGKRPLSFSWSSLDSGSKYKHIFTQLLQHNKAAISKKIRNLKSRTCPAQNQKAQDTS